MEAALLKGIWGSWWTSWQGQQRTAAAAEAHWILGCICRGMAGRDGGVLTPLCSASVRMHRAPYSGLRKDTDKLECPKEKHKGGHEAENLPCERSLKELDLFFLQKRHLREETHHSIPVLQGQVQEDRKSQRTHRHDKG